MKPQLPVILAIMQNQWFNNPEKVRSMIASITEHDGVAAAEEYRRRVIHYALFAGCKSGRVLERVFGRDLCQQMKWDEASREIGGRASDCFPADIEHIRAVIAYHQPAVIITFGNIARDGVNKVDPKLPVIFAPHPTARHATALKELETAAGLLRKAIGVQP